MYTNGKYEELKDKIPLPKYGSDFSKFDTSRPGISSGELAAGKFLQSQGWDKNQIRDLYDKALWVLDQKDGLTSDAVQFVMVHEYKVDRKFWRGFCKAWGV